MESKKIDFCRLPKESQDQFCSDVLKTMVAMFKDPEFQKDYEKWKKDKDGQRKKELLA